MDKMEEEENPSRSEYARAWHLLPLTSFATHVFINFPLQFHLVLKAQP